MPTDRRTFLQLLTTGAAAAAFPSSIARALEIPAHNRTRSINDIEHIVILMQENRSFDHYFGTLNGVRGYGDPRVVKLSNGDPVWFQPNGSGYLLPFHPDAPSLGLQFIVDLAHDWTSTHAAWNQGKYDQWVAQKTTTTMAHLTRGDIPFHYALADSFTICDAYHCSLLGPTDPNRYYMWTGWAGNDGKNGGPVIDNAELGYDWSTYPERLQAAGISWKVYQDKGESLDAPHFWGFTEDAYIGNFGDNSLLYFHQYQNAAPGSSLFNGALTGTDIMTTGTLFDQFRNDVQANKLPQVSWIVAPEAYSEHPNWPANYGAWYVSQMLDVLTSNPDLWSKTALFLTYDENDGFFDHAVPPTVPPSSSQGKSTVDTVNEIFTGSPSYPTSEFPAGPYGMGIRVPMLVISPWSKGGWVNSEVFDHSSLVRFIEQRFGPTEPNITPWRRAVAGDLTSAFNFRTPNDHKAPLPSTTAYIPPDDNRHPNYTPTPPTEQALPAQEQGTRPARALPYELYAHGDTDFSTGSFNLHFANLGKAAALQVRSGNSSTGPWTYTVGRGHELSDNFAVTAEGLTAYDLSAYGPNGFLRAFKGAVAKQSAHLEVRNAYEIQGNGIVLFIRNLGLSKTEVRVTDAYTGDTFKQTLHPGEALERTWHLDHSHGWYDLTVTVESDASFSRQLAGHVETGNDSVTDPAIAS